MQTPLEREALGLPKYGTAAEIHAAKKAQERVEAQAARDKKRAEAIATAAQDDVKVAAKKEAARVRMAKARAAIGTHKGLPAEAMRAVETFDTEGDLVDIWNRRMINPDQRQTKPIRITTPGMHLRWINLQSNGRYQRARYDEGWVPVRKTELVDAREIYGASYTTEGYVCRGERQQEMLMKIPEAIWKKIRARRHELVKKSNQQISEHMQAQGAKHFADKYNSTRGEEIADTMGSFKGAVKFGTEQIEPEPGDLEPSTEPAEV